MNLTFLSSVIVAMCMNSAFASWDDDKFVPYWASTPKKSDKRIDLDLPTCPELLEPEHPHHYDFYFKGQTPRMVATGRDKDFQLAATHSTLKRASISERSNVESLMVNYGLTRLQAVEVQARYRYDFHRQPATEASFLRLVEEVKGGSVLSGIDPLKLATYKAVVAIDVDGTLLDQDGHFWKDGWTNFSAEVDGKSSIYIAMAPGWDEFLVGLKKRGLGIVLFSRNSDHLIHGIAEMVSIQGVPLKSFVDGILSSSHMTEVRVRGDFQTNAYFYKDLRLLDEAGTKTILVDDNLSWIRPEDLQRTQYVAPFEQKETPSAFDKAKYDKHRQQFISQFQGILKNIDQAMSDSGAKSISFTDAYSQFSSVKEQEIIDALTWLKKSAPVSVENEVMGTTQWSMLEGLIAVRQEPGTRELLLKKFRDKDKEKKAPLGLGLSSRIFTWRD